MTGSNQNASVTLTNTTVSHNSAFADAGVTVINGGGILLNNGSHLIVINSTVTDNTSASETVSGVGASGGGGVYFGVRNASRLNDVTMSNSIVAGNTNGDITGSFASGTIKSQGYNLIGSVGTDVSITGTTTGNIVGTSAKLAPLGFYGGATQTHALLTTSPAIDAGNTATSPATDQRGAARVNTADIGAFELEPVMHFTGREN